jgi:hypothetical protein
VTPASFTRRSVALLAGAAALSLVATFALGVFGDLLAEPPTAGKDAWSRSAIGHRAFLELARGEGYAVHLSRNRTAAKASGSVITVLLEPGMGEEGGRAEAMLNDIRDRSRRLLVVLPKREGAPDPFRPRWIGSVRYAPIESARRVLKAVSLDAEVIRPPRAPAAWTGPLPAPEVADPQLIRSQHLQPLVGSGEGMLVGEIATDTLRVIVVADPDALASHGLGRGRNAELAMAILDRFGGERTLLVDETLHGHEIAPSITRELLRFPLVLATLQALVALGLLAWAALVRFGRPLPAPPALAPGKAFLVENTAELLRAGGHAAEAARAYLRASLEVVLARMPPPGGAETPETWLLRLEAARGREGTLRRLQWRVARMVDGKRGAEAEAVRAAQQISRWREELTDGAASDPRTRRGAQG